MKQIGIILTAVLCLSFLCGCSLTGNLTDRESVLKFYEKHRDTLAEAVESGDYGKAERLRNVHEVSVWEDSVEFSCGGSGFGPSTHYYGIFYSPTDDLTAIWCAGPAEELTEQGDGYFYKERGGDNRYYVEPLDDHFYYYEAHF